MLGTSEIMLILICLESPLIFFSKTSSKENIEFVQYVFKKLYDKGHIYEEDVIQFYCPFDNKFLPDRYVIGKCPNLWGRKSIF